jgi:hypothetical protein
VRPLLLLCVLALCAPSALAQRAPVESAPAVEAVSPATWLAVLPLPPELEPRWAREALEGAEEAQPGVGNFLYQLLLAAATALVTALIWRVVF